MNLVQPIFGHEMDRSNGEKALSGKGTERVISGTPPRIT